GVSGDGAAHLLADRRTGSGKVGGAHRHPPPHRRAGTRRDLGRDRGRGAAPRRRVRGVSPRDRGIEEGRADLETGALSGRLVVGGLGILNGVTLISRMAISVLVAGDIAFREAIAAALGREYTLVETESVTAAADALLEDASQVIFARANAVEAKDAYTEGHTERVGALAVEAGRLAGLDEEICEALRQGGVLHDIGKIGIPNEIINKAGRLTDKE